MNPAHLSIVPIRDGDCNVQPPSKKRAMIDSSAERPARGRDHPRIAYIHCPRCCWHRPPDVVSKAIENAFKLGSTIINLVFDDEKDAKLLKLEDQWNNNFATVPLGAVVSLYSRDSWQLLKCEDIDPICKSPCVMLTFSGRAFPFYRLTVIAVAFPAVPRTVRNHILDVCIEKARQSLSDAIIIGGLFNSNVLWLENRVCKLNLDIPISVNHELYVLAWCATGIVKCIALDSKDPFTVLMQLDG